MKRFQLMLPDPMRQDLEKLAAESGLTIAELIRRAIAEFIEKQKQMK